MTVHETATQRDCLRLRVAFAGTPEFAALALDALIASDHEVVCVLSQPDRPAGRGRKLTPSAVKQRALMAGIPILQPTNLRDTDARQALAAIAPDVLVVAAYGLILPQAILDLPPLGCLNIHASLLPRWRGAAPIQRAILAGDTRTGVCIMQMDAGLDTGDILLQRELTIDADESAGELHDRLAALGAEALLATLSPLCRGELKPVVQGESGVTYAEKLSKVEARLDFSRSAIDLHRKIRAFNPRPVAAADLGSERVRVWSSRLVAADAIEPPALDSAAGTIVEVLPEALRVRTGDGLIDLLQLQWPGKRRQSAAQFSHGRALQGEAFTIS